MTTFSPPPSGAGLLHFGEIAYTPSVQQAQAEHGGQVCRPEDSPTRLSLTEMERRFIAERDSFYLATVGEQGWPYVQHKGGPPGFLQAIGPQDLLLADYEGNRQYVSLGNLAANPRLSMILVDYPNRRRLKLMASLDQVLKAVDAPADLLARLPQDSRSPVARLLCLRLHAFDWNCPQHITPRFTQPLTSF
jgi:predicted pyridoxine 5'-phosphate oxidase superfamily flavin-nucleotide-binding protein